MTREEAIRTLKEHKITFQHDFGWNTSTLKALDMAIKALEQEPCEDCISREAVMEYLCSHCPYSLECYSNCDDINKIRALPSIQPKEIYNKGYKDGQEALAFHLELCKEEGSIITVPEGATNGEVAMQLFRDKGESIKVCTYNDKLIGVKLIKEWWDSPYRKEQE